MTRDVDVVVVGSGIGGMSAAAVLAAVGKKVLVAEQADGLGGYAHAFRRGEYLFDPAVHATAQGQPGRFPDVLLNFLGVRDLCELVAVHSFYATSFPGFSLTAPSGADAFVAAHVEAFPEHADAIRKFFALCARVHSEAHQLPPQLSLRELDEAAARFPTLFEYQKLTVAEVLDEHFDDERVKAVCAASWPYLGLPPSQLSFLVLAQMFNVHVEGSYYCLGSFQSLIDALAAAVARNGGELAVETRVERITHDGARVTGVVLADGSEVHAPVVISNADARRTFDELVGADELPAPFLRKLRKLEPSLSAFVLFGATDVDLANEGLEHETFVHLHWDHEQSYRDVLAGRPGGIWINLPTLVDPSLAPAGTHLVIVSALAAHDTERGPWDAIRDEYARELLAAAEGAMPVLAGAVEIVETATPETFAAYTGNAGGAAYGWANTPAQVASRRLSHVTPIQGLYLSGHWTQPGSNSIRVLMSGVHTAQIALAQAGEPVPQLEPEDQLARAW